MSKITAELVQQSQQSINPCKERMLLLKGLKLSVIENLGCTLDHFDCIDLSDNEIKKLGNFTVLQRLKTLILNNNRISKIQNIGESLPNLQNLCIMNNKIQELTELDNLQDCKKLERLILFNNVVTQAPNYRLYAISKIPSLRVLDFKKIKKKEREEALKIFNQKEKNELDQNTISMKEKIRKMIENAKTLEEINRLEVLIKSGELGPTYFEKTLKNLKQLN